MADRKNFFHGQLVDATDLNPAFGGLEQSDFNIVADTGLFGMIVNGVVVQHSPAANLTVDVSGGAIGYDQLGERVAWPTTQNVDVSQDFASVSTAVAGGGNEKWISVFAYFARVLSDPRVAPDSSTVQFDSAEGFAFYVTQGAEAAIGTAAKPALQATKILLADVNMRHSVTAVLNASIDTTRRQDEFVLTGGPFSSRRGRLLDVLQDLMNAVNSVSGGSVSGISTANISGATITETTFSVGAGTLAAQLPALAGVIDGDRGSANNVGIARVQQYTSLANARAGAAPAVNGIMILTPAANSGATIAISDNAGGTINVAGWGGIYFWDATSTAVDDGRDVIQVTGTATGRWRLTRGPGSIVYENHNVNTSTMQASATGGSVGVSISAWGFHFNTPSDVVLNDIIEIDLSFNAQMFIPPTDLSGSVTLQFRLNNTTLLGTQPQAFSQLFVPSSSSLTQLPQVTLNAKISYTVTSADITTGSVGIDAIFTASTSGVNANGYVSASKVRIIRP